MEWSQLLITKIYKVQWRFNENNVVKTIINNPFANGLYHVSMVIWGMVYYCVNYRSEFMSAKTGIELEKDQHRWDLISKGRNLVNRKRDLATRSRQVITESNYHMLSPYMMMGLYQGSLELNFVTTHPILISKFFVKCLVIHLLSTARSIVHQI